jgi:hypothetical protein
MSTHRGTWKRREREGAGIFGVKRQVLSGSSGRDDKSKSDSTHERLYIETKLRAKTATRAIWDATNKKAKFEHKTPVVLLYDKNKSGALIVVHQDDLAAVAAELSPGRMPVVTTENPEAAAVVDQDHT